MATLAGDRWVLAGTQSVVAVTTRQCSSLRAKLYEALAGLVDGSGATTVDFPSTCDHLRRVQLQKMLEWQGQRSLEAHWYSEIPANEPYYRVAGLAYLEDAAAIRRGQTSSELDKLREQLEQPGNLILTGPGRIDITSELQWDAGYQLQPAQGATVPSGYPVVWFEADSKLQLSEPAPQERLLRQAHHAVLRHLFPVNVAASQPQFAFEFPDAFVVHGWSPR